MDRNFPARLLPGLFPRFDGPEKGGGFVGEDGTGSRQGETGVSCLTSGRNREPSREGSVCPETERNSPFDAEDASETRNDRLWPRNETNMPARLPQACIARGFNIFISFRGPCINELFCLGASGYLLKNSTGSDIVAAIRAALKGDHYPSPAISKQVIQDCISMKKESATDDLYGQLPNREREVFQMIAEGRSTKEISDIPRISPGAAKTRRTKIMEKLQVKNVSRLIQFAIRLGIVDIQV